MGVLCYTLIPRVMRILVSGKRTVLKFRHYEKAIKFEKNLPPILPKQLFLLSIVKKSGSCFFQIFVAFSERLDFMQNEH